MKAVVKVKSSSPMSHLNGQTFEVTKMFDSLITISTPNDKYCPFNFNEVVIIDIDAELNEAYLSYRWAVVNDLDASEVEGEYTNLLRYCRKNKIKVNIGVR